MRQDPSTHILLNTAPAALPPFASLVLEGNIRMNNNFTPPFLQPCLSTTNPSFSWAGWVFYLPHTSLLKYQNTVTDTQQWPFLITFSGAREFLRLNLPTMLEDLSLLLSVCGKGSQSKYIIIPLLHLHNYILTNLTLYIQTYNVTDYKYMLFYWIWLQKILDVL